MKIYNVSEPIVQHYINIVEAGRRTIKEVPEKFRGEVAGFLNISLEEITVKQAITDKIAECSKKSEQMIVNGIDIEILNGLRHYSLKIEDQNNINKLFEIAVSTKSDSIPYHADNKQCELYKYSDIVKLYFESQKHILYHNALKSYIKTLTNIEDVKNIEYGIELSDKYAATVNNLWNQSIALLKETISSYGITIE